jgi:hypothetical protein
VAPARRQAEALGVVQEVVRAIATCKRREQLKKEAPPFAPAMSARARRGNAR